MSNIAENFEEAIKGRDMPLTENESISERIIDPRGLEPLYPDWVKEENESTKNDTINSEILGEGDLEIEVTEKNVPHKAQRILQLVAAGEPLHLAAKKMNTTVRDLMSSNNFKGAIKTLIETRSVPNEVRREMVRAYLNDTLMVNAGGGPKKEKLAMAAAKEIAKDPDVGLNTAPTGTFISVDMGKLGELLTKVTPLPGLEEYVKKD